MTLEEQLYRAAQDHGGGDSLIPKILPLIEQDRVEQAKAYGGCTNCYGKGYATKQDFVSGGGKKWRASPIKLCTCGRGEQLEQLIAQRDIDSRIEELEDALNHSNAHVSYDPEDRTIMTMRDEHLKRRLAELKKQRKEKS